MIILDKFLIRVGGLEDVFFINIGIVVFIKLDVE